MFINHNKQKSLNYFNTYVQNQILHHISKPYCASYYLYLSNVFSGVFSTIFLAGIQNN